MFWILFCSCCFLFIVTSHFSQGPISNWYFPVTGQVFILNFLASVCSGFWLCAERRSSDDLAMLHLWCQDLVHKYQQRAIKYCCTVTDENCAAGVPLYCYLQQLHLCSMRISLVSSKANQWLLIAVIRHKYRLMIRDKWYCSCMRDSHCSNFLTSCAIITLPHVPAWRSFTSWVFWRFFSCYCSVTRTLSVSFLQANHMQKHQRNHNSKEHKNLNPNNMKLWI